ncbi:MAG: pseudouridine synthase [Clostridiaceae bacterium]|nr:pseudouridine synthase [Clostridiaceae bacterium]MDY5890113.1 pseudouridine synthase [Oscillospiraceae bacterium]
MTDDRIRLQKYLSMCAVASRRKSEELIAQGKVKINGKVAQIGDKVSPKRDTVTVSGKKVAAHKSKIYIMLYKPRGFITTMDDEMGRKCVAELVSDVGERVYPVGRLDKDSEGLLLLTNDGEFANHMTHPSKHIPKTYRVTVRPDVTDDMLTVFSTGMEIDGRMTAPADAHIIEKQDNRVVLEIVLYEGRNRQIRKMCEALGLEVARLKRSSMGSLKLGMLPPGKWRELTEDEVHKLMVSSGMKVNKF